MSYRAKKCLRTCHFCRACQSASGVDGPISPVLGPCMTDLELEWRTLLASMNESNGLNTNGTHLGGESWFECSWSGLIVIVVVGSRGLGLWPWTTTRRKSGFPNLAASSATRGERPQSVIIRRVPLAYLEQGQQHERFCGNESNDIPHKTWCLESIRRCPKHWAIWECYSRIEHSGRF